VAWVEFRDELSMLLPPARSLETGYSWLVPLLTSKAQARVAYVGLAGSTSLIESLRRRGVPHHLAAFSRIGALGPGPFDLIVLDGALETEPDLVESIRRVRAALVLGGGVYVGADGLMQLHRRADLWFDYLRFRHLARFYDLDLGSLVQVMSAGGFVLVEGDESIEATFRLGSGSPVREEPALHVLGYLALCEREREYWMERETDRKADKAEIRELRAQLESKESVIEELRTRLTRMESSSSWRVTKPLREASLGVKRLLSK
jgi:hypothetical protein